MISQDEKQTQETENTYNNAETNGTELATANQKAPCGRRYCLPQTLFVKGLRVGCFLST
jgi:hypothetical protein